MRLKSFSGVSPVTDAVIQDWKASVTVEAPLNDFNLMGELLRYPHKGISTVTSQKLGFYLLYISEEVVWLALFDSRIPTKTERLMIAAMEDVVP